MIPLKLNSADLAAKNARVRFAQLKSRRTRCKGCDRRLVCSIRLKVCFVCFWGERLQQKDNEEGYFDDFD